MQPLKTCAIALLGSLMLAQPAEAEMKASGSFSYTPLSIKGLKIRDSVVVGEDFAKKHKVGVKAPFEFHVPRIDGLIRRARYTDVLGDAYIKIIYGTPQEEFVESIQFNHFSIPQTLPLKERRKQMASFLKNVVWAQITKEQGEKKIDVFRDTTVGEFAAVELIGRYADIKEKGNGTLLARLVALIRKDQPNGLIATINIATKRVQVRNDGEMAQTLSNDILGSVAFR